MNQNYFGKYYRRAIFKLAFSCIQPGFFRLYHKIKDTEKLNHLEMEQQQILQLKNMLRNSYNDIPYYNKLFKLK